MPEALGRKGGRPPRIAEAYAPAAGAADELIDASGAIRPVWRPFLDHLDRLRPGELARRAARGDQRLRDAGVYYRQYEGAGSVERAWPFSHLPVLMPESEWRAISAGLVQRAELLEALAADLYGENRMVAEGRLPAALVAQSRGWLRPLVGVTPRSGRFLHILAFELGRGPDGSWWILGDRAEAPSGAGFALENRLASSQVFPEFFAEAGVLRLSGFFRAFRDALQSQIGGDGGRVAILTPGMLNDSYFEHAYIARYLGFSLLEGEDLLVEDGRVMMRTVEGPRPVGVIWRRLDSAFADPLELNESSRLGTPGLLGAIRAGGVTMANALGAGVLEMRALLAFLPRLSERLVGEPLALPNIATWWCGQAAERAHVRANAERMMIGSAFATRLPFETGDATVLGGAVRRGARETFEALIERDAPRLVGQEAVKLSTTPALVDGRLAPRPMSLRLYLARTPEGWAVMPGGYARIGRTADAAAITLQAGGSVADVWIMPDGPAAEPAPSLAAASARPQVTALPSRAADNLFWMGRYVERAEDMMRLLRAYHVRRAETRDGAAPLLTLIAERMEEVGLDPSEPLPEGLRRALASAIGCASRVRDRFSVDGWSALRELDDTARAFADNLRPGDDVARAMSVLLRTNAGFSGLVHENMYRTTGWRFLSLGRSIERACATAASLAILTDREAPEGALDLAVELGDSVMTHRRRYAFSISRETVLDLLALDSQNPRSVLYDLDEIRERVAELPGARSDGRLSSLARAALAAYSGLATRTPETLDAKALLRVCEDLADLSERLTAAHFNVGRRDDL